MDTPRPNRVTLVFALSEEGRRDAFRQGHSIEVPENGDLSIQWWDVDSTTEPELFDRAASLDLRLSSTGTEAEVPIGCSYADHNDWWRLSDDGRPVRPTETPMVFQTRWQRLPLAPENRPPVPVILIAPVDFDSLAEMHDELPDYFVRHFVGFDRYPTVEELIESEESARNDAALRLPAFADEEAALRTRYALWLEGSKRQITESFEQWVAAEPGELPEYMLVDYRDELDAIRPESGNAAVTRVFATMPDRLCKQLREARNRSTAAAERAEATAWADTNGSSRLQRIAAEGVIGSSMAVYRDERLALERGGWGWVPQRVVLRDPAAPDEEEFELLDSSRSIAPDARLKFATLGKGSGRFVAVAEFLGRRIWYPGDALEEIEQAGR